MLPYAIVQFKEYQDYEPLFMEKCDTDVRHFHCYPLGGT